MKIALMHNPAAGSEDHSAEELIDEIHRAGHRVVAHVTRKRELRAALHDGCDLVAIAGGDGTVGKAAHVLKGTSTPFTVLALGTANNIARTLRVTGTTAEQIASWTARVVRGFDVAEATIDGEAVDFIEALGFGVFPRVMRANRDAPAPDGAEATLARDLQALHDRIATAPTRPYRITGDGRDLSGNYVMVEILNIPTIGPRLTIAADADPHDGKLDLVVAGEHERAVLLRGIERNAAGEDVAISLPCWRATTISIAGRMRRHHCDGELHEVRTRSLTVRQRHHALCTLAPTEAADVNRRD
jgi:diacylglycerol kinase family enzyme